MRRFGKLRTRLLSSFRKRAPRRSTDNLATPEEADSNSTISDNATDEKPSLQQLHWSEARRIYSEPASRELKVERESSEDTASVDSSSSNLVMVTGKKKGVKKPRGGGQAVRTSTRKERHGTATTTCSSTDDSGSGESPEDAELQCACGAESDGEDDDVFLESWEEVAAANTTAAKGQYAVLGWYPRLCACKCIIITLAILSQSVMHVL